MDQPTVDVPTEFGPDMSETAIETIEAGQAGDAADGSVDPVQSMFDLIGPQNEEREYLSTGGRGQSREFYIGGAQFEREMAKVFRESWLPVDHVSRFRKMGQFITLNIGDESVLIIRNDHGIQAYHNYCRHRGFKLMEQPQGCQQNFVCSYHCWQYNRNGQLTSYNGTYLEHFFNAEDWGLLPIRTEVRYGIVFISFAEDPPSLDEHLGEFPAFADRYELADLRCSLAKDYPVDSNWKLIVHNVNESLHFPSSHKDLHRVTDFDDAGTYELQGNIIGAWQSIRMGFNSISMSGESNRHALQRVPPLDQQRVNWITILPNLLFGFTSDYVMMQWAWPESADRSLVRHFWLFHPEEIARPTFTHADVFALWDKANYEDWELCERTHRGIRNAHFTPGPLALDEEVIHQFDQYVVRLTSENPS